MGEHRLLKKGPLLFTTALLSFYPVCMAEAATSSFEKSPLLSATSAPYGHLTPSLAESKRLGQTQSLPKSYRDLLSPASLLPSIEDLNTLESTLSRLENQLKTLYISKAKDPLNTPALSKAITDVENSISTLKKDIQTLKNDLLALKNAEISLSNALQTLSSAQTALTNAQDAKTSASNTLLTSKEAKSNQQVLTDASKIALDTAQSLYDQSLTKKQLSDASLTHQQEVTAQALQTLNERQAQTSTSAESLAQAQATYNEAEQARQEAQAAYDQAQHNYNNNLIPDPSWTPPTYQKENIRLVPVTTTVTETTQSPNILPALDHTIWTGAGTGFQNARPTINGGVLKFSYMQQSVTYTKQENLQGPLTLSVDVKNNDQNRGQQDTYKIELHTYNASGQQNGYAVYNSPTGWHDWTQRQITVDPTSPVASYKVTLTGFDGGYWAGTYGPEMRTPTLSATITTTTTTTTYTYETYYTTEPVLIEGTLQVKINEGGQATFTAPEGSTFTSSNLRYEAKDRPECGVDINPPVQGKTQVTISADNGVWGDPCGGWYKHVTGTISYLGQPTAPLIKDPALLPALQQAQENLTNAEEYAAIKLQTLNEAKANNQETISQLQTAQQNYNTEAAKSQELQTLNEALSLEVITNKTSLDNYSQNHEKELNNLSVATTNETLATTALEDATSKLTTAEKNLEEATLQETTAKNEYSSVQTSNEASFEVATSSSSRIQPLIDAANEILNKEPKPEPEPEQGSAEIPAIIENLMDVDLNAVDPTELTPEQAVQLVEAALVAFETATEGSPEYEQALDALYLAAEQDDIELPAELAAIPGLAGAVEVLNFLGNAGADMSPKVREESEKVVIATVIAAGAAIQAATGAATSAAVSASAPSGGSRRIGK